MLFDGRRIWSLDPTRFSLGGDGSRLVKWPRRLVPRLHGSARVTVRTHVSEEVILDQEVRFDAAAERLQLSDSKDRALTVTKWGSLAPAFADAGSDDREALVVAVAEVLRTINEGTRLPAFAAYGTLLGAVRSGRLIGHDHDADIAFLSDAQHPADLARDSFALQRFLHRHGWDARRGGNAFLTVHVQLPSGASSHIDVFTAHHLGDMLYLERWVSGPVRRHELLPLGEVVLEGQPLAAPRDPPALLAATYGPGWATPDPSFSFSVPIAVRRHFGGWMGSFALGRARWSKYHSEGRVDVADVGPSDFARWASDRLVTGAAVCDLGCGAGTDSLWYARAGHRVLGVDQTGAARAAAAHAVHNALPAKFVTCSLYDLRRSLAIAGTFVADHPGPRFVTARLLLDALTPSGRRHLWWMCRAMLRDGGALFLEFRAGPGVPPGHRPTAPWLGLLGAEEVTSEVIARGGTIEAHEVVPPAAGRHQEAPLTRMVVRWTG